MSGRDPDGRIACVEGDLTAFSGCAIVNAANESLRGGGGVDGAIHRAAGPGLLRECIARHPDGCPTGEARITGGHGLAARFVIHTPGPVWRGGAAGEPALLAACHRNALRVADEHGCRTVAFPAISCGVFGYPPALAAATAIAAVRAELPACTHVEHVTFVLFGDAMQRAFAAALAAATS